MPFDAGRQRVLHCRIAIVTKKLSEVSMRRLVQPQSPDIQPAQ